MINFIGILKYGGGTAAYHVQAVEGDNYQARLISSTSEKKIPNKFSIKNTLFLQAGMTMEDLLVNKIISVIKVNKFIEDHAQYGSDIN
ncbi:MAG: hypothetical protein NVS9B7_03630 [Flavisolibacter sp.]